MRFKHFLFLIPLAFSIHSLAQLKPVFVFEKDDTVVRNNYYSQTAFKKDQLLSSLPKQYASDYKEVYTDEFKEIGDLWKSTRPITSPAVQAYLQTIVQKIISSNKELKGTDARVVFSRDWWPNAVSMGDGTIAINAGLVIYLDNEAELVFVICHELSHYYLDHTGKTIKKYVDQINSVEYQNELKRIYKTEYGGNKQVEQLARSFAFNSRRHSRDNEAEADRQALRFMVNTGYDCGAIVDCLNLLDKVDDSLLFKPLQVEQVFNFKDYPFKKKWIQKESSIFSQLKDDDSVLTQREKDSLKTHPDCQKRIALIKDSVDKLMGKGQKFFVNEKEFNDLKNIFLAEITEECYKENNLSRNLYYSLLLMQKQEYFPFAVLSVSRCLNAIYEHQRDHKLGLAIATENKSYPSDYNQLLRMLSRLRLDEIANLNYHFCEEYSDIMNPYEGFEQQKTKAHMYLN